MAVLAARGTGAMGRGRSRSETRLGRGLLGRTGAFAAFLGIVLKNSPRPLGEGPGVRAYLWQAIAVGDTCLFHTRDSALLRAFPLDRSVAFGNRPQLVGSRMPAAAVEKRQRLWSDGCGQSGDRLWAMTDALAKWCLTEHEAGGNPWRELESLLPPSPSGRGAGVRAASLPPGSKASATRGGYTTTT